MPDRIDDESLVRERARPDTRADSSTRPANRARIDFALIAAVATGVPLAFWILSTLAGHGSSFNDFHDFYYAARLILEGHSPYDKAALAALAKTEGQAFVVGTGYSYPLPFAIAMIPFAWLPFGTSVMAFGGLGLALYGLVVGRWIVWFHGSAASLRRRLLLAAIAGAYPSIYGTIANGQANLLLMPFLAFGTIYVLDGERVGRIGGGIAVGLAAVVKLIPGLFVVPLVLGRRFGSAAAVVVAAGAALGLASLLLPWAQQGSDGLLNLTEPDAYFTNQSINGFVSRLVLQSERTLPLWNHAFDARIVAALATICLGLLTLWILWARRLELRQRRGLAIGLALALTAGLLAAPKGTYWNQAMLVVAAGLVIAVEIPDLRLTRSDGRRVVHRVDYGLVGSWLLGTTMQTALWFTPPPKFTELSAVVTLATSASVYGMAALYAFVGRRLWITHRGM